MGVKELLRLLRQDLAVDPHATIIDKKQTIDDLLCKQKIDLWAIDLMSRCYKVVNWAKFRRPASSDVRDDRVTSEEVFFYFFHRMMEVLQRSQATWNVSPMVLLTADKREFVPKEKRRIQKKRRETFQRGHNKLGEDNKTYPASSVICDGGLRRSSDAPVEPFDMNCLKYSGLWTSLLVYVFRRLMNDSTTLMLPWPKDTQILVDLDVLPQDLGLSPPSSIPVPLLFELQQDPKNPTKKKWNVTLQHGLTNKCGEAEFSIIRYSLLLGGDSKQQYRIALDTPDSDALLLALYHLFEKNSLNQLQVWWINDSERLWLIHDLYQVLHEKNIPIQALLTASLFSGCDYFEKDWCTYFVSLKDIFHGCRQVIQESKDDKDLLQVFTDPCVEEKRQKQYFHDHLVAIHSKTWNIPLQQSLQQIQTIIVQKNAKNNKHKSPRKDNDKMTKAQGFNRIIENFDSYFAFWKFAVFYFVSYLDQI